MSDSNGGGLVPQTVRIVLTYVVTTMWVLSIIASIIVQTLTGQTVAAMTATSAAFTVVVTAIFAGGALARRLPDDRNES